MNALEKIKAEIVEAHEFSRCLWKEWYRYNGMFGLTRVELHEADARLEDLRNQRDILERG